MTADTDREARLERIRSAAEDEHYLALDGKDVRWLLSEVDRLREIEEAARDVADAFGPKVWRDATVGRAGVYSGDAEDAETVERLEAKLEGEDD